MSFIIIEMINKIYLLIQLSYVPSLQTEAQNSDMIHQFLNLKTFETIHSASLVFLKTAGLLHQKLGLIIPPIS
jgi:hypothetical protein